MTSISSVPVHPVEGLLASQNSLHGDALAQVTLLSELGLLQFQGQDAVTFLQGQTTNDMFSVTETQARLAGYCTAQGRLLASAVFWKASTMPDEPTVMALLRGDILTTTQQRLMMFVLRSKVKITTVDSIKPAGVTVAKADLGQLEKRLGHDLPAHPWQVIQGETGTWIASPNEGSSTYRFWWLAGKELTEKASALHGVFVVSQGGEWQSADVRAGLPWITAATRDLFIPQTLNLDLIEGVSFTKGCYPGQEVVARSHYRGTLKRRMAMGWTPCQDVALATDIVESTEPDRPCGRVINQSWDGDKQWLLLECTFDALSRGRLHLTGRPEDPIHLLPLPYPVPHPGQAL